MHRILVSTDSLAQERPVLPPEAARHLKVVRVKDGERVELFDGAGRHRVYAWSAAARELLAAEACVAAPPPVRELVLFACVTKGSRWDWTIEKAVELGVTRIVPVISDRVIVRIPQAERAAKAERWRRIAEDAARQSDALWLPKIAPAVDFPEAVEVVKGLGRVFVGALVQPPPPSLLAALARADVPHDASLGVFVGPEGDFTPAEMAALLQVAEPVSFGPTVLRAETAAIFGVSILAAWRHHAVPERRHLPPTR